MRPFLNYYDVKRKSSPLVNIQATCLFNEIINVRKADHKQIKSKVPYQMSALLQNVSLDSECSYI